MDDGVICHARRAATSGRAIFVPQAGGADRGGSSFARNPQACERGSCDAFGLSVRFEELYSHTGRPSIAPEYLLRATLLQAFFTVRSERQLMEQIDYNLLFRWFVGLSIDDPVWDASVFSKNRERLLETAVARESLATLLSLPQVKRLLSSDHFSVDGTLVEAWASMKSFRPKDGSGDPPNQGSNQDR